MELNGEEDQLQLGISSVNRQLKQRIQGNRMVGSIGQGWFTIPPTPHHEHQHTPQHEHTPPTRHRKRRNPQPRALTLTFPTLPSPQPQTESVFKPSGYPLQENSSFHPSWPQNPPGQPPVTATLSPKQEQQQIRADLLSELGKCQFEGDLIRENQGFFHFWPEFHLHRCGDSLRLLSAKKTSSRPTSVFLLSRNRTLFEENSSHHLAKLQSRSLLGDVINLYGPSHNCPSQIQDTGELTRQILATVCPGLPLKVFLRRGGEDYWELEGVRKGEEISLDKLYHLPGNRGRIRQLKGRQPIWDENRGGKRLDFRGKARVASVKNFILEDEDGEEAVLFGRQGENKFRLWATRGVSVVVALSIALSTFDSRLFCQ